MLRESDIHKDEKMQEDVMVKYIRYQYNTFLCVKREEYNPWIHFLHLRMQLQTCGKKQSTSYQPCSAQQPS